MHFDIKFQDHHLTQVLKVIAHELVTPQQMLGSLGESLLRVNRDRHASGLDPNGKPWEPLKPSTLKEKRKGGPLNKTGEMLQSLNYQVESTTLVLGFDGARNNMLANIHHDGTDAYLIEPLNKKALAFNGRVVKKVNHPGLPARPLLGFGDSDQELVSDVIEDHLMFVLNRVQN